MGNIDPTARAIGAIVIGAVILLAVLSHFNLAGTTTVSVGK
jgi:hypothetical protein